MARRKRQVGGWMAALAGLIVAIGLAGCNTMEGVGRDMQGLGRYMSNTAEDANPYGP